MYTLISATPSPYARKVRIALAEKGIPFTLRTEVPWDGTTETPRWNPLEKLPVLIRDADQVAVYESHHILEWIEGRHPTPSMLPDGIDGVLEARRIEVLADGVCDAFVLMFFENQRAPERRSEPWIARQRRKVDGGLRALSELAEGGEWLVGARFGLADIAVGTVVKYLSVRAPWLGVEAAYPVLAGMSERLERRPSFAATVPVPQVITDAVV